MEYLSKSRLHIVCSEQLFNAGKPFLPEFSNYKFGGHLRPTYTVAWWSYQAIPCNRANGVLRPVICGTGWKSFLSQMVYHINQFKTIHDSAHIWLEPWYKQHFVDITFMISISTVSLHFISQYNVMLMHESAPICHRFNWWISTSLSIWWQSSANRKHQDYLLLRKSKVLKHIGDSNMSQTKKKGKITLLPVEMHLKGVGVTYNSE